MRTELAVLGSLMLVAGAVPITLAHNLDSGASDDNEGVGPETTGVYGRFVGTAGPIAIANTSELGAVGQGVVACDFEVEHTGDFTGTTSPVTEDYVDGSAAPGPTPDSTFDDGGQGGACHTADFYSNPDWNTPGCEDFNGNGVNDRVGGESLPAPSQPTRFLDTFVVATCDSETGPTEGFLLCVVNYLFLAHPQGIVEECPDRLDPREPTPGFFLECGPDRVPDYVTSGYVDGLQSFPAPTVGPDCAESDGELALFVFAGADAAETKVSKPATGWVGTLNN